MFKYDENRILEDIKNYIDSTYISHYVGNSGIQVNDLIMAIGHGEGAYISNAIEYLARYGKKDGKNVKDLYKAIHNIILLIHQNHTNDMLDIQEAIKHHNLYFGDKGIADDI